MKCGACGNANVALDLTNGEYYCSKCGLVVEDQVLDFSQVYLPSAQGTHHAGAATSFVKYDKGLGTLIDTKLPVSKRLKGLHLIGTPNTNAERSFSRALPILESAWSLLRVPQSVKVHSAILYYKCMEIGITRGRRTEEIVGAIMYIATTAANMETSLSNLSTVLDISEKRLRKQINQINRRLNKETRKDVNYYLKICLRSLNIGTQARERIQRIVNSVSDKKLEIGKNPAVVAGEIVYKACLNQGDSISQERIAMCLNISERSIRRTVKEWEGMVAYKRMSFSPMRNTVPKSQRTV